MKIYSLIITIIAILAVMCAGYFFFQSSAIQPTLNLCETAKENLVTENAKLQNDVTNLQTKITEASSIVAVLQPAAESFIFPGDYKALSIGTAEATEIDGLIAALTDKMTRLNAEHGWNEFKTTLEFNPFFGFLRGTLGSLETTLSRPLPKN